MRASPRHRWEDNIKSVRNAGKVTHQKYTSAGSLPTHHNAICWELSRHTWDTLGGVLQVGIGTTTPS